MGKMPPEGVDGKSDDDGGDVALVRAVVSIRPLRPRGAPAQVTTNAPIADGAGLLAALQSVVGSLGFDEPVTFTLANQHASEALRAAAALIRCARDLDSLGADAVDTEPDLCRVVRSVSDVLSGANERDVDVRLNFVLREVERAVDEMTDLEEVDWLDKAKARENAERWVWSSFERRCTERLGGLHDIPSAREALDRVCTVPRKGGRGKSWVGPFRELWTAVTGEPDVRDENGKSMSNEALRRRGDRLSKKP